MTTKAEGDKAETPPENGGNTTHRDAARPDTTGARSPSRSVPVPAAAAVVPRSPSRVVPAPAAAQKVPSGEPDHASVREKKEQDEAAANEAKEARTARRKRIKSGHLSGKWVVVGNSLVNVDAAAKIDLPTEGDENPSVSFTTFGGQTVTASGDEAAEIMEELGLEPTPKKEPTAANMVHRDDGRIRTAEDHEADEKNPGRIDSIPVHSHRANAVLTNAETDFDVENRAGGAVIPPAREIGIPGGEGTEAANDTGNGDGDGEGDGDAADAGARGDAENGSGETPPAGARTTGTRARPAATGTRGGKKGR